MKKRRSGSTPTTTPWTDYLITLGLAVAVMAVYWQVGGFQFLNYDDPGYVQENQRVQNGLTWDNVVWAFATKTSDGWHVTSDQSNWHPLTWLSYLLDVSVSRLMPDGELLALSPGPHHLVNLAMHLASTILLFLVLMHMTKARWPSAAVAILFALHPLHVESVAWISERKDVLSGLFWMLTMGAYAYYTDRPSVGRYLAVFFCFALGLMAKPMLVTLPLVLLLLDIWPLGRLRWIGPVAPPFGKIRSGSS
jgi:protein O-mannosyl-transferase